MRFILLILSLVLMSCEKNFPESISISLKEEPVFDFSMLGNYRILVGPSGKVSWNVWIEDCPSEEDVNYQFSRAEYEKVVYLAKKVFEYDYNPSGIRDTEETQIYTLRFGDYWNSVVLNIRVKELEGRSERLVNLIEYLHELKTDKTIPPGKPSSMCMENKKYRNL